MLANYVYIFCKYEEKETEGCSRIDSKNYKRIGELSLYSIGACLYDANPELVYLQTTITILFVMYSRFIHLQILITFQ